MNQKGESILLLCILLFLFFLLIIFGAAICFLMHIGRHVKDREALDELSRGLIHHASNKRSDFL